MADKIEYILVEAYQKLKILLCVPESLNVDMLSRLEEYEDGMEALTTLQNLWKLEEAAGVIKNKMAKVEASRSDDIEMNQLMSDLDGTIRFIPRLASENDITQSILINDGKPANSQSGVFLYALDQYIHSRLNYISMTDQAEKEKRENENNTQARVQQYEAARHTLQLELEQKMKKYKEEIEESEKQFELSKGQLADVKMKYENGNASLNKFIEDQKRKQEEDHMAFLRKYNEESSKVNKEVNKTNRELQDKQNALMKTRARLRMELDELLENYDKDMADWDKRIKQLTKQHNKEKKELEFLDDHFRKIDEERERIAKEEAEIKAKAELFQAYKIKLEKAANGLQRLFRGYKDRKIFAQLKAKKKKSEKKSKKSKSKKV